MMKSEPLREKKSSTSTVAMSVVRGIVQAAESIGLTSDALFKEAGLDYEETRKSRITGAQFVALWEATARLSRDPHCGLHIGEKTKPSSAHLVGHLLMNCKTVGQAVDAYLRYQRIVSDFLEVRIDQNDGHSYLTVQILDHSVRYSRQLIEWVIAGEAALLQELSLRPIKPLKIWFTHPATNDVSEYLRVFKAPVMFGRPVNAVVLSSVDLAMPIRQADPELFSIFERQAQEYLSSLEQSLRYSDRVRRLLVAMIQNGRPTIKRISSELNSSPRTLQLKLKSEDTSFQAILDDTRKQLALGYLENERLKVSEIGYLLGFSEPSVFIRAFRKWTGKSPGSYRRALSMRR